MERESGISVLSSINKSIHGMSKFLSGEIEEIVNSLQQIEKEELIKDSMNNG